MRTIKCFSRWFAFVVTLIGWYVFYGANAFAEDVVTKRAANAAVESVDSVKATNSIATTNNPEADKAWKEVLKASQPPMVPAEWQQKQPTIEEQRAFYIPLLTGGPTKRRIFIRSIRITRGLARPKRRRSCC